MRDIQEIYEYAEIFSKTSDKTRIAKMLQALLRAEISSGIVIGVKRMMELENKYE